MPQFIFQKYVDKDYEEKQRYIAEISESVIKINMSALKVPLMRDISLTLLHFSLMKNLFLRSSPKQNPTHS